MQEGIGNNMIKFYVQQNYARDVVEIYACSEENNNNYGIELEQFKDGDLKVTRRELKSHEDPDLKPVLRITREFAKELLPALQAALDNAGIEKPSESKIQGKLEATERHLADLQKLIFKTK